MKKSAFIVLMPAAFLAALVAMGLLFSDVGAVIYLIALALFAAVLTPFGLWLKRETDEAKKRKIRLIIFLIQLTPVAVAIVAIVIFVIAMMSMF